MSEITVSRQTGLVGVLLKVNVYINGECVANLSKDETVTLPLPERRNRILTNYRFLSHSLFIVYSSWFDDDEHDKTLIRFLGESGGPVQS